jgi:hypothetical protein
VSSTFCPYRSIFSGLFVAARQASSANPRIRHAWFAFFIGARRAMIQALKVEKQTAKDAKRAKGCCYLCIPAPTLFEQELVREIASKSHICDLPSYGILGQARRRLDINTLLPFRKRS